MTVQVLPMFNPNSAANIVQCFTFFVLKWNVICQIIQRPPVTTSMPLRYLPVASFVVTGIINLSNLINSTLNLKWKKNNSQNKVFKVVKTKKMFTCYFVFISYPSQKINQNCKIHKTRWHSSRMPMTCFDGHHQMCAIPTRGNFISCWKFFERLWCQYCTKLSTSFYLWKIRRR